MKTLFNIYKVGQDKHHDDVVIARKLKRYNEVFYKASKEYWSEGVTETCIKKLPKQLSIKKLPFIVDKIWEV